MYRVLYTSKEAFIVTTKRLRRQWYPAFVLESTRAQNENWKLLNLCHAEAMPSLRSY